MRTPYLYTSRMCVFDKRANRFVGNVLGVRPNNVTTNERKWAFDESDKVIVRCSCVQVWPNTHCMAKHCIDMLISGLIFYPWPKTLNARAGAPIASCLAPAS